MIEDFVNFMLTDLHKTPNTANEVIKGVRSFFGSERISLDPRLVSECASIPKSYKDTESDFVLNKATASKILGAPMKRRLRVFLYTLASSGARVGELSAIRWNDLDLKAEPVSIHLRAENTKTKVGRTVYVTETAEEIRQWVKYREECRSRSNKNGNATSAVIDPDEYVFQVYSNKNKETDSKHIMHEMQVCFSKHLKSLGLHHVVSMRRKRL